MKTSQALTPVQKKRFVFLRQQFFDACNIGDIEVSRKIIFDLKNLLIPLGKSTKYHELLLSYCELLILKKEYVKAEKFLLTITLKSSGTTRLFQEANILLSIAKLHLHDYKSSERYLSVALHSTAIKGSDRRRLFLENISERFEEEALLVSFGERSCSVNEEEALEKIKQNFMLNVSDDDLLADIGSGVPQKSIEFMRHIHEMAKRQLTYDEKMMLPSPPGERNRISVGKRVFSGFSRRVWMVLCPDQCGVKKSLKTFQDPCFVSTTIMTEVVSQGFKFPVASMLISITTYIVKKGLGVYCDKFKPVPMMADRYKRS